MLPLGEKEIRGRLSYLDRADAPSFNGARNSIDIMNLTFGVGWMRVKTRIKRTRVPNVYATDTKRDNSVQEITTVLGR